MLPALVLGVATWLGGTGVAPALASAPLSAPLSAMSATTATAATVDEDAEALDPLEVTLDGVSPAVIPRRGPLTLRGHVTNTTHEDWSEINLHPVVSPAPMTSTAELSAAAASPATEYIGNRITREGSFFTVEQLTAGSTASFQITVPRDVLDQEISGAPGVYWLGVHALGQSPTGRTDSANGRVRTFIPLVGPTRRSVKTSLVLPVRRNVTHTADGKVIGVDRWNRDLGPGGRLNSIVALGEAAGDRPLTWALDPAVPATVTSLVAGNPTRFLGPTVDRQPEQEPDDDPSPSEPQLTTVPPEDSPLDPEVPRTAAEQTAMALGGPWLGRLRDVLREGQVLALPYGDLDVAAAGELDPELYALARKRSDATLKQLSLDGTPAVVPPQGYLDAAGISVTEESTTVLLSEAAVTATGDEDGADAAPAVAAVDGRRVLLAQAGASSGASEPSADPTPLSVRQRILGEAALRVLAGDDTPLVAALPASWNPTTSRDFFEGLDEARWLELATLEDATGSVPARAIPSEDLVYPEKQAELELPAANLAASTALIAAGETLQNVLIRNDAVAAEITGEALSDASYFARDRPGVFLERTEQTREWVEDQLAMVRIEAPRSVTLSSESGRFAATLVNGLDQPVGVRIEAVTESPLTIRAPREIRLEAESSTTVLLQASSDQIGVHTVTLEVTDLSGQRLGSSDTLPLRTAQVSEIIWVIMAIGAGLLFAAIALRLVRRLRRSRSDAPPTPDE